MREFTGKARVAIWAWAAAFAVFQLYTQATVQLPIFAHRSVHLFFGLTLLFLLYPVARGKTKGIWLVLDIGMVLVVMAVLSRLMIAGWNEIPVMEVVRPGTRDIVLSVLFILLCLEAARRTIGWPLVTVAGVSMAYAFLGPWAPGIFKHPGINVQDFIIGNFMTEVGTFGQAMGLSSGMLFAVVAFGAFMLGLGGGELLVKVAMALTGRFRGGPAKVAVVASAFFSTVSGSSTANVASTGMFTIPMMKRVGYKPAFAGAVEACASNGGALTPPVMGITAFIMSEFLGIPYSKLILYAAIPAIFYFTIVFLQVHLEAVKQNLRPVPQEEIPKLSEIHVAEWILLLPVAVFLYFIVIKQMSVGLSAFYATVSIWACYIVRDLLVKRGRVDFKQFAIAFEKPARQILQILGAMVMVGIVVYSVEITGLGTKFSLALVELSGSNLILLMFFAMIASLILGLGLPGIACYIFLAVLTAPALIKLGVLPLAAHMFVFYFGNQSSVTPPVGSTYYVAAGIAEAPPQKTGLIAMKLGIAGYLVPFMFALAPSLLLQGGVIDILRDSISLMAGAFGLAVMAEGYLFRKLSVFWRIITGAAALMLVYPGLITDVIGYFVLTLFVVFEVLVSRRARAGDYATKE
ncbi:TRAP transporter permease [Chloroflexota bacterium]